jgi:hypothetical protein
VHATLAARVDADVPITIRSLADIAEVPVIFRDKQGNHAYLSRSLTTLVIKRLFVAFRSAVLLW